MSNVNTTIPNAGQTYMPCQDNINVPFLPYEKPAKPDPLLPELELKEAYIEQGYVLPSQKQHFLPGVTSEMMDWFWANLEKCYYLWAPGSHKKFSWVKSPVQYGMDASVHMISESCEPGLAVFGGEGVEIHRLALEDFFPFTTCLKHVICEGVFNDLGDGRFYSAHVGRCRRWMCTYHSDCTECESIYAAVIYFGYSEGKS